MDKVYQLLAHGRWFSPGTLASPTTKTGRHEFNKKKKSAKVGSIIILKVCLIYFSAQPKKQNT
jgi:hypothetical protein